MPCAICVDDKLWYPTKPPPRPLTTLAAPAALSSSLASPSRSVDISTAEVMSRTPKTLRPMTATAPGAWSKTTSHRTRSMNTSGWRSSGSNDVPNTPAFASFAFAASPTIASAANPNRSESRKNPNRL